MKPTSHDAPLNLRAKMQGDWTPNVEDEVDLSNKDRRPWVLVNAYGEILSCSALLVNSSVVFKLEKAGIPHAAVQLVWPFISATISSGQASCSDGEWVKVKLDGR